MGKYTSLRSGLIKSRIKEASWKKREHIEDLIFLENYILRQNRFLCYEDSMKLASIKNNYPQEYEAIYLELSPLEYKRIIQEEKEHEEESRKRRERFAAQLREIEEKDKQDWVMAGGAS